MRAKSRESPLGTHLTFVRRVSDAEASPLLRVVRDKLQQQRLTRRVHGRRQTRAAEPGQLRRAAGGAVKQLDEVEPTAASILQLQVEVEERQADREAERDADEVIQAVDCARVALGKVRRLELTTQLCELEGAVLCRRKERKPSKVSEQDGGTDGRTEGRTDYFEEVTGVLVLAHE